MKKFKNILWQILDITSTIILIWCTIAYIIIAIAMPNEDGVNMGIMNRLRKSCG